MSSKGNGAKKATKMATALAIKKMKFATLKIQLIVGGIILLILIFVVLMAGLVSIIGGDGEDIDPQNAELPPGQANVTDDVLRYRDKVHEELSKYDMTEYTDVVLALMMQESGGKGLDPMQSSESYCGSVGCITDQDLSIEKGVLHFKNVMESANFDVKLALQSYNFGGGFINFVNGRGGNYTFELAVEFSQNKYKELRHLGIYSCLRAEALQYMACYGDILYVDAVMKYLPAVSGDTDLVIGDYHSPLKIELRLTSPFSWRDIGEGDEHHNGIDFGCNENDSIHAVKEGKIVHAGWSNGYGNLVTIKHAENHFTSYAHMSKIHVKTGSTVSGGNQLGMCGTTGRSFGTHLHFEVKTEMWGGFMNPATYLGL